MRYSSGEIDRAINRVNHPTLRALGIANDTSFALNWCWRINIPATRAAFVAQNNALPDCPKFVERFISYE